MLQINNGVAQRTPGSHRGRLRQLFAAVFFSPSPAEYSASAMR